MPTYELTFSLLDYVFVTDNYIYLTKANCEIIAFVIVAKLHVFGATLKIQM